MAANPQAPFRLVGVADVPPEWRAQPSSEYIREAAVKLGKPASELEAHVGREIPDFPLFHSWAAWVAKQDSTDSVGFCITSRDQWKPGELRASFTALLTTGRPLLRWVRMFADRHSQ